MADEPRGDDLVELGRREFRLPGWPSSRLPGWRPPAKLSRGAGVLAVAALAVGLVVGYAAGDNARGGAAVPAPSASPTAPATETFPAAGTPALTQDTGACSLQHGQDLVLGIQLTNQSTQPLTLTTSRAVLPFGGLKQLSWQWATCGAIAAPPGQAESILMPGQSTWLAVTFHVTMHCPSPAPVQFTVGYLVGSRPATARLPGFADLSVVPYSGCPAPSATPAAPPMALINWPASR
jgi:hypothetical protein